MANSREAKAGIKINKLLEEAGCRFFDDEIGHANIQLEPNVKIKDESLYRQEETREKYLFFLDIIHCIWLYLFPVAACIGIIYNQ